MRLTPERVSTFKQLYSKRYGITLSDQEALDKAIRFVSLIGVVLKESARHISSATVTPTKRLDSQLAN